MFIVFLAGMLHGKLSERPTDLQICYRDKKCCLIISRILVYGPNSETNLLHTQTESVRRAYTYMHLVCWLFTEILLPRYINLLDLTLPSAETE